MSGWEAVYRTLAVEFSDLGDVSQWTRVVVRLTLAALLGGALGWERESRAKSAGVRTHMLVALGATTLLRRHRQDPATPLRPFLVGTVHGLAGSAVLALLLISSTSSAIVAATYLLCFCVGTIAGMATISVLMAMPMRSSIGLAFERRIRIAAGTASVVLGLLVAHRVGVEEGLFAATLPLLPIP